MLYGLKLYIFSNYQLITFGGTHVVCMWCHGQSYECMKHVFLKCCNDPNTKCLITSDCYHEKLLLPKNLEKKGQVTGTLECDRGSMLVYFDLNVSEVIEKEQEML